MTGRYTWWLNTSELDVEGASSMAAVVGGDRGPAYINTLNTKTV
jgi:hypothetical protein